ncbi:MAG: hypothetical protein IIW54_10125, partial [Lachnospiraceae bacterium]|nr:hypothetical protein [Lachnospiraceae bacterium]
MLSAINSIGLKGIQTYKADIQVDLSRGLPAFDIVGLAGTTVKESRERVRAAIKNIGISFPAMRITCNLAPADIRKDSSMYDLPIAVGILAAMEEIASSNIDEYIVLGELSLDGKISKNFSYSLCHNLFSQRGEDDSVFDNTNWLTLSYDLGNFSFSAGKDALVVGSYEYDAYDIDSYYDMNSLFYNSFSSYQWGVKAMWTNKSETTSIAFQVANSPFVYAPKMENLYSYNIGWYESWDWY